MAKEKANFVVCEVRPKTAIPTRLEGIVSADADNVSVIHKMPGSIKTSTTVINKSDVVCYMAAEQGFVVFENLEPITKVAGKLTRNKAGNTVIVTDAGNVVFPESNAVMLKTSVIEEGSKEAKAADRMSRVKAKVKQPKEKSAKKPKKTKPSKGDKAEKKTRRKRK